MANRFKTPDGKRAANAARQAEYRKRHLQTGASLVDVRARINVVAAPLTASGLKRLARHWGLSQVDALARIVADAENKATKGMSIKEERVYYDEDVTA
jgi:hypothetical protein